MVVIPLYNSEVKREPHQQTRYQTVCRKMHTSEQSLESGTRVHQHAKLDVFQELKAYQYPCLAVRLSPQWIHFLSIVRSYFLLVHYLYPMWNHDQYSDWSLKYAQGSCQVC